MPSQKYMNVHFSSETDLWSTPQDVFDTLNKEFHFTLDPCATKENAKCDMYYTKEQDGLKQGWKNERVFMNPPYRREIGRWGQKGAQGGAQSGVCLLPG